MHRQRGAISIIAAATLVVSVLIVALALDIGRIVLEKQRLQAAADAAAMAGARVLAVEGQIGEVAAAAQAAAVKNGYAGNLATEAGAIDIGHLLHAGGLRGFALGPGPTAPAHHAVRVTATRKVPRSLVAAGLLPGDVILSAQAVAHQVSTATFSLGTALLRVDSSREATLLNALLGSMLGTELKLGVLDYKALVGANVELGELAAALHVGSVDNLLREEITLGELISESITILEGRKDDESARLAAIALNDHLLNIPGNIRLGDLLGLATDSAGAAVQVNVADLIMASAQLATAGDVAGVQVDLDDTLAPLGLGGVPGLDLTLDLKVGTPPQIGAGPPGPLGCAPDDCYTSAEVAQTEITVKASVLNLINLDITIEGAGGKAWLEAVEPPTPSSRARVRVGMETDAARVTLNGSLTVNTILFGKKNIPLLGVNTELAGGEYERTFTGPFPSSMPDDSSVGASGLNALQLSVSLPLLDTLGVTSLVNALLSSLTHDLLSPLIDNLLSPLTKLLGLQIGGADVTVLHASAGEVRLVQ